MTVCRPRKRNLAAALAAAALLVPAGIGAVPAAADRPAAESAEAAGPARLLVTVAAGAEPAVEREVRSAGGEVTKRLPLVSALAVSVPAAVVPALASVPGVVQVAPDEKAHVLGAAADGGPASVFRQVVGSDEAERKARASGAGVGVALIDTGIADVPDLAGRVKPVVDDLGRPRPCLNLSGESDCRDSFGHGTFVAGLIAGNGASSGGVHRGVAPAADLISIKVAGRDGSSDVSTILAAIQWVVSYRDTYNIRVLNLSLGTDSSQSYRVDPLNFAVERAWAAGITVVVAAGNLGPGAGSVTKPADDPFVISVGALDDRGTPGLGDDMLPDFSSRGPTIADGVSKPDLVAPGGRLLSLRSPGSTIDVQFPPSTDGAYRRGSGTSMAAGTVSGIAALMLQMDPAMTPDRLKFALTDTAAGAASFDRNAVGAGVPSAYRATTKAGPGVANVGLARSNGLGRLDLSRGSVLVQSEGPLGVTLDATSTAQLVLWQPTAFTASAWNTVSWQLSPFALSTWPGTVWAEGKNWQGKNWQGKNWQGKNWQGASWYGQHDETTDYGEAGDGSASYGAWD